MSDADLTQLCTCGHDLGSHDSSKRGSPCAARVDPALLGGGRSLVRGPLVRGSFACACRAFDPAVTAPSMVRAFAEQLVDAVRDPTIGAVAVPSDKFARLLALLTRALPHVPRKLAAEIREAIREGFS